MRIPRLTIPLGDLTDFKKGFDAVIRWTARLGELDFGTSRRGVKDVNSDVTLDEDDSGSNIRVDATAGVVHVTLPSDAKAGTTFHIKRLNPPPNFVTVVGPIDGFDSISLDTQNKALTFSSNGTGWDLM